MFSRTTLEAYEALMNCYREGTLGEVKKWVEREIIGVNATPSYDKYTFFNALRMVFARFMSDGDETGILTMLELLNIDFFGTSEDICYHRLGKFRCHLCLVIAEAVIEARHSLESNTTFRDTLRNMLLEFMGEVDFIEMLPVNSRIKWRCTEALRILGCEICDPSPENSESQERMRSPPPDEDEEPQPKDGVEPDPNQPGPSSRKEVIENRPPAAKTRFGASILAELKREDRESDSESSDEFSDYEY